MGRIKYTTESFIVKAKEVHGNKYDYSKVNYTSSKTKIEIICPEHGSFWKTPNDHLSGQGCYLCSNMSKHNDRNIGIDNFIIKAKEAHGNKYDYSKSIYYNMNTKIEIICPIHGSFFQCPKDHINRRNGCPKCKGKNKSSLDFVEELKNIYSDSFKYDKVKYINNKTPVQLYCPKHGYFNKTPNCLLLGQGCPKCGRYKQGRSTALTQEQFIEKAKKIHGNKYDYSSSIYINNNTKVLINCPIHGYFKQRPIHHLSGCGCPHCKESQGEKLIREYMISHSISYIPQHKFKDCKDKRPLPFDFYLPDYNTCIEYDGIQHFDENQQFMKNKKKYQYTLHHDQIKTNYCKQNNIKLLRIPYTEANNIEEILRKELNLND